MFLRNYWYVAAWDHEVTRQHMLRRIFLNEPVVRAQRIRERRNAVLNE